MKRLSIVITLLAAGLFLYAQTSFEPPTFFTQIADQTSQTNHLPLLINPILQDEDNKAEEMMKTTREKENSMMIPDCRELKDATNFWKEVDSKFFNTYGSEKKAIPHHVFKDVIYRGSDGVGIMTCDGIVYVCKDEMPKLIWTEIETTFELIE